MKGDCLKKAYEVVPANGDYFNLGSFWQKLCEQEPDSYTILQSFQTSDICVLPL